MSFNAKLYINKTKVKTATWSETILGMKNHEPKKNKKKMKIIKEKNQSNANKSHYIHGALYSPTFSILKWDNSIGSRVIQSFEQILFSRQFQ